MKQVYWLDLPGNKYLKKIEASMLSPQGCVIEQEFKILGKKEKEQVKVLYDRDYVISKLSIEVLEPLKIESFEQFINLVSGLWTEIAISREAS